MLNATTAAAIRAMGQGLGPQVVASCRDLFAPEQAPLAAALPPVVEDAAYGPHERHRLDLYRLPETEGPRPILLFVHGGGFVLGDKGGPWAGPGQPGNWVNAHVGRMAARAGLVGAVMNYRLAAHGQWPAGPEDVALAVAWLKAHAAQHGGDTDRIVLVGTSAGAVHVAGYLAAGGVDVRGAVLLSGLYGYTPLDPRDEAYYGPQAEYAAKAPREGLLASPVPLLVACAQYDPPRFQAEFLGLAGERLAQGGAMGRTLTLPGHNHYTMAMHLGSADRRLEAEILRFVADLG